MTRTIAGQIYDYVASLEGAGCGLLDIIDQHPNIDPSSIESAVHRLRNDGVLRSSGTRTGKFYYLEKGAARPADGRGRPPK